MHGAGPVRAMDWVPAYGLLRWRGPGCLADSWWLTRRNVSIESKGIDWSILWQPWAIPLALLPLTVYTLCKFRVVKMNDDGRSENGKADLRCRSDFSIQGKSNMR